MPPLRVLLADDHAGFLAAMTVFLEPDEDIEVVGQATSGEEAVKQVVQLRPDLVLMDLAMPGMDGFEATRRIKALPNAPRVIVLTFHDGLSYRDRAESCGADGFLSKSFFDAQLRLVIARLFCP